MARRIKPKQTMWNKKNPKRGETISIDPEWLQKEIDRLRAGSPPTLGRRPVADKRQMIRIFPQQSRIDALGGESALKIKLMTYIEKVYAAGAKKLKK